MNHVKKTCILSYLFQSYNLHRSSNPAYNITEFQSQKAILDSGKKIMF